MKKNRFLLVVLVFILSFSIGLGDAFAFITGRNYGFKDGNVVTWNNSKYYVKPHWNIYFESFSNHVGTAMHFKNIYDSSKGYLVVGNDQWNDWIAAFGANYNNVVSKINYTAVKTPVGTYNFAWLSEIANASGWRVKDWSSTGQWAIYEKIPVTPPPPPNDPPPPPPPPPPVEDSALVTTAAVKYDQGTSVPNPFTLQVQLQNNGIKSATDINLHVILSDKLYFESNQKTVLDVPVSDVGPNGRSNYVNLNIIAKPIHDITYNQTITATVTYKKDGKDRNPITKTITFNVLPAKYPILVIPGILGSWPTEIGGIDKPNYSGNWETGFVINSNIPRVNNNPYKILIDDIVQNAKYTRDLNIFEVPYDWRKRNEDTVKNYLVPKLITARDQFISTYKLPSNASTIYAYNTFDTGKPEPRWFNGEPFWIYDRESKKYRWDYRLTENGDKTVLWESTLLPGDSKQVINYTEVVDDSHGGIPKSDKTISFIYDKLKLGVYNPKNLKNPNKIAFQLLCPADLLVTDPLGRRVGYINGQFINEIGDNIYVSGKQGDGQSIIIFDPAQGNYNISVISQGEGTFQLYTWSDVQDNTQMQEFDGSLKSGVNLNYKATYNPLATEEQNLAVEMADSVAPVTTIVLNGLQGNDQWYITPVYVNLNAIDNLNGVGVAKIEYSLDGGQTWNDYGLPLSLNSTGVYDIRYRSVDFFGNQEAEKTTIVKVDLIAPNTGVTIKGQQGNQPWFITDVQVQLQGSDNEHGSGVIKTLYSLDGGKTWNTYSGPIFLSTGKHNLLYKSIDAAGLEEVNQTKEIYVDTIKPETKASTVGKKGNNGWFLSDVQLNLSATDNLSGIESILYSLDYGNTWQTYSSPLSITINGKNVILYKSVDKAGNIEDIKEISIWVDKIAPITNNSLVGTQGNLPWFISNVSVLFDAIDNNEGSGIEKIEYSYDGLKWSLYEGNLIFSNEGKTTVFYKATDKAGNEEIYKQQDIYIDKTPPIINVASPLKSLYYLNEPLIVDFNSIDYISGVQSSKAFLNNVYVSNGQSIVLNKIGPYEFVVEASDIAGNRSTQTVNFEVKYIIEWLPPISVKGDKAFNANSTVPVKFIAYDYYKVPQVDMSAKLVVSGSFGKDERIIGEGADFIRIAQETNTAYYIVNVKLKDYNFTQDSEFIDLTAMFNGYDQGTTKINVMK